jgi:YVTN family beta-propeller protein
MTTARSWISGLLVLVLLTVGGCDSTDPVVRTNPPDALYVCNQGSGTVSVISPASDSVVTTVDLVEKEAIASRNPKPHHVVVEPDGSAWYVSLINENAVVKLNARNEVVGQVSFPSPGMLSLDPDSDRLYAGHTMSLPDVPRTLAVVQRSDMSRVEVITVSFRRPHAMKVNPNAPFAYSASLSTNRIVAIDTDTNDRQAPAFFGEASRQRYVQMDVTADGDTAFVTGQVAGQVQVLNLDDPAAPRLVDSVDVGAEPWHPQLSADGETLYFGSKATDTVYGMDTETFDTTTITGEGLAEPHGSALSPDGQTLYVSNNNQNGTYPAPGGTVVAINTETNDIQAVIEVGKNPAGINTRWQP